MRQSRRIFSRVATVSSAVLLVATLALWVRSQWVTDQWRSYRVYREGRPVVAEEAAVATYRNALAFRVATDAFVAEAVSITGHEWTAEVLPQDVAWSHRASARGGDGLPFHTRPGPLGFIWDREVSEPRIVAGEPIAPHRVGRSVILIRTIGEKDYLIHREYTAVGVPWWWLSVLFAVCPLLAVRRGIARRRRRPGFCEGCGYDLRATLERCPECGRIAAA